MPLRYRFEISVKDFKLQNHFTVKEENGLEWCKKYMSTFQKQVVNIEMKVAVFERENKRRIGSIMGNPIYIRRHLLRSSLH